MPIYQHLAHARNCNTRCLSRIKCKHIATSRLLAGSVTMCIVKWIPLRYQLKSIISCHISILDERIVGRESCLYV